MGGAPSRHGNPIQDHVPGRCGRGSLWLLLHRRWLDLLRFASLTAIFSLGPYLLTAWREPAMLQNILSMGRILPHPSGVLTFYLDTLQEPVFLIALVGMIPILLTPRRLRQSHWQLLLIYFTVSLAIATATSVQAGANINYFYEPLLVSVPSR